MTANTRTNTHQLENYRTGNAQKKSGHPTQPGNRSTAPRQTQKKGKQQSIIYKILRIVKRIKWGRIAVLCLAIMGVIHLFSLAFGNGKSTGADITGAQDPIVEEAPTVPEYIFRDGDGSPVDMQAMTNAWAAEYGTEKRYELTDTERWEVASVVTAEAGGEPFAGMIAVAQCILQVCEDDGIRPCEAVTKYKYTKNRPEPSAYALTAVQAVFDLGQVATHQPIKYFYAPALVNSEWHESLDYVMTINGHKFFKETGRN